MDFNEYEKGGDAAFEQLAELVVGLIKDAVRQRDDIPRVQAYQARAKGLKSLKRKLEKRGLLDSLDIDLGIKDLAGVRVILYTNIDLNRFLQSRVIDALTIHWDEAKAHYPSDENGGIKYEGSHYIVSLPDAITAEERYAHLKGLRCEVQVQTLLAHAFAESSHDIIYKGDDTPGFGARARQAMTDRLNKTVDDLLKPAGYALDKVQGDFENLSKGIELFDRRELERLLASVDNNERYDRLEAISDYLLPHYDDIGTVIAEIHRALLATATDARNARTKPRVIGGYEFGGNSANDVTFLVIGILDNLRYVDVESTLKSLIALYKSDNDREVRQKILDTAEHLASYNAQVWRQVGPGVQIYLGDTLSKMSDADIEAIRPLATTIWRGLLGSEVDGTTWSANAVTISKGAISATSDISAMRSSAIEGLTGLLDRSKSDDQRRTIISAFWEAAQLPSQANYSNDLLKTAIRDLRAIADVLLPRLAGMGFDVWESIESHLYREYWRFKPLAEAKNDEKGCQAEAEKLVSAIKAIRTRMNRTSTYVKYKTLVGFEGVFSQQWDHEDFEYEKIDAYRKDRAARFIDQITESNAPRWIEFIKQCAGTKSNDMATFPIFGQFLMGVGEKRPAVAVRAIDSGNSDVLNFLPSLLSGLAKSVAQDDYRRIISGFVDRGQHLAAIVRHYQYKPGAAIVEVEAVLGSAISAKDVVAVMDCVALAVNAWPTIGNEVIPRLFLPAMAWLTAQKDTRWVRGVWYMRHLREFLESLDPSQAELVLDNLLHIKRVNHEVERILACLGTPNPGIVWAFFRDRLALDQDTDETGYQPIPFRVHDLQRVLAADPLAAIRELRSWFRTGDNMFQFTGGRLLHAIFQFFSPSLANALLRVCKPWDKDDIDFALLVTRNYSGEEAIHEVAKALVGAMAEDDRRLGSVSILLENTGVVAGEFGMFEAMRERKARMVKWRDDGNPKVRAFAESAIRQLDNRIATEKRDADMRKEQRKRDFE